jgi:hypothetical protein
MAKWRALHGEISQSEKVAELTEFEALLYTWMIAHADDYGILTGTPKGIKMTVIPGIDRSLEDIEKALDHMAEVGLIWRYSTEDGRRLVARGRPFRSLSAWAGTPSG